MYRVHLCGDDELLTPAPFSEAYFSALKRGPSIQNSQSRRCEKRNLQKVLGGKSAPPWPCRHCTGNSMLWPAQTKQSRPRDQADNRPSGERRDAKMK